MTRPYRRRRSLVERARSRASGQTAARGGKRGERAKTFRGRVEPWENGDRPRKGGRSLTLERPLEVHLGEPRGCVGVGRRHGLRVAAAREARSEVPGAKGRSRKVARKRGFQSHFAATGPGSDDVVRHLQPRGPGSDGGRDEPRHDRGDRRRGGRRPRPLLPGARLVQIAPIAPRARARQRHPAGRVPPASQPGRAGGARRVCGVGARPRGEDVPRPEAARMPRVGRPGERREAEGESGARVHRWDAASSPSVARSRQSE